MIKNLVYNWRASQTILPFKTQDNSINRVIWRYETSQGLMADLHMHDLICRDFRRNPRYPKMRWIYRKSQQKSMLYAAPPVKFSSMEGFSLHNTMTYSAETVCILSPNQPSDISS